eukprot:12914584-Prorocentrum_lima.AAC.1
MKVVVGGIQVEDISDYNRWYECLHMFQSKGKRLNDASEGFSAGDTPISFTSPAVGAAVNTTITP